MDYSAFYKDINISEQIKKLSVKYKKVIIYGAGLMSDVLFREYKDELKNLNIVAICDRKYNSCKNETYFGYPAIPLSEILNYEFDAVLVNLRCGVSPTKDIQKFLYNTDNPKTVKKLFKMPFLYCLKHIIG